MSSGRLQRIRVCLWLFSCRYSAETAPSWFARVDLDAGEQGWTKAPLRVIVWLATLDLTVNRQTRQGVRDAKVAILIPGGIATATVTEPARIQALHCRFLLRLAAYFIFSISGKGQLRSK